MIKNLITVSAVLLDGDRDTLTVIAAENQHEEKKFAIAKTMFVAELLRIENFAFVNESISAQRMCDEASGTDKACDFFMFADESEVGVDGDDEASGVRVFICRDFSMM